MSSLLMKKKGTMNEVRTVLQANEDKLGISLEEVGRFLDETHFFCVYEKYYMRSSGYTSLSILMYQKEENVMLEAIGAGGGDGLFNISWGSEKNFVKKLKTALEEQGFITISFT